MSQLNEAEIAEGMFEILRTAARYWDALSDLASRLDEDDIVEHLQVDAADADYCSALQSFLERLRDDVYQGQMCALRDFAKSQQIFRQHPQLLEKLVEETGMKSLREISL